MQSQTWSKSAQNLDACFMPSAWSKPSYVSIFQKQDMHATLFTVLMDTLMTEAVLWWVMWLKSQRQIPFCPQLVHRRSHSQSSGGHTSAWWLHPWLQWRWCTLSQIPGRKSLCLATATAEGGKCSAESKFTSSCNLLKGIITLQDWNEWLCSLTSMQCGLGSRLSIRLIYE